MIQAFKEAVRLRTYPLRPTKVDYILLGTQAIITLSCICGLLLFLVWAAVVIVVN